MFGLTGSSLPPSSLSLSSSLLASAHIRVRGGITGGEGSGAWVGWDEAAGVRGMGCGVNHDHLIIVYVHGTLDLMNK